MLELCKKADILERSGELLCKARVSVGRTGDILMIIPASVSYKPNGRHYVVFYDPHSGLVTCECRLSAPVKLPNEELCFLRCEVLEHLTSLQRRQDVKVPVQIHVMLHASYLPGDSVRIPELGYPATIDNISAGGVYLRTGLSLAVGRRIWFILRHTDEEITLSVQILRAENLTNHHGRGMYGYGCKFVNPLARQKALLRSFVYQEEWKQRLRRGNGR